jgi:hypothetical protein
MSYLKKLQQVLINIEDRSITLQAKKHKAPTGRDCAGIIKTINVEYCEKCHSG